MNKGCGTLILAAGKGTRMKSNLPKVLHLMLEEPLISYPISASHEAGLDDVCVLVGNEGKAVESYLKKNEDVTVAWQTEQKGTGHAVLCAESFWKEFDSVLVMPGDVPLISPETLREFKSQYDASGSVCSVLTFDVDDPTGYGRIVRCNDKVSIVEEKDASADIKKIREVNSGIYLFNTNELAIAIKSLTNDNAAGEYYLTDVLTILQDRGLKVSALKIGVPDEFNGVNNQLQLAQVTEIARKKIVEKLMLEKGLRCMDPGTVWIGPRVKIGNNVTIYPSVQLWGDTVVDDEVFIGSFSVLRSCYIQKCANLKGSVRMNNGSVGPRASAGPFAFMREGAVLLENAHIGRFVEIKNSVVGESSMVPHLSYVGDTTIGTHTNLGAGTITCNYDGVNKNKTVIGDHCLIGSSTMLVAPVTVGDWVSTGAGSVITQDVPSDALGIARAKQQNIENWAQLHRKDIKK
ncbi:MAG: bifunctional UDP-N-acetylglucosamine diphosphorylase/glucosamine-1-phosphate N-acetyltransferase GlmU [Synergistaceae bacterium]|nr:bifunctional UDP-N-acetylglucosamine diphosphorylase/glucosamine-1-phosphate N-acetyltransferase GlmU [Synergistaceae bacterium]